MTILNIYSGKPLKTQNTPLRQKRNTSQPSTDLHRRANGASAMQQKGGVGSIRMCGRAYRHLGFHHATMPTSFVKTQNVENWRLRDRNLRRLYVLVSRTAGVHSSAQSLLALATDCAKLRQEFHRSRTLQMGMRRCSHASCSKASSFSVKGSKTAAYCRLHAKDGMVNDRRKRCFNDSCIKQPSFNFAVSYTHLRAHETRGNLVCRLQHAACSTLLSCCP